MNRGDLAMVLFVPALVLVLVLLATWTTFRPSPECVHPDLSDMPEEAIVAPRELSTGIWI